MEGYYGRLKLRIRAEKRNSIFCAFFGERIRRGGGGSLNFLLHDARIAHIYTEHWYDVLYHVVGFLVISAKENSRRRR